jgi:hypothetical protein
VDVEVMAGAGGFLTIGERGKVEVEEVTKGGAVLL